jgi:cytochrome P450
MISAGADTTALSMSGVYITLARFPEVQEKLYKILESQDFRADEFKDCPYLQAVIYETYRYCPIIYRTLFHSITEKTEILGKYLQSKQAN